MKGKKTLVLVLVLGAAAILFALYACSPSKPEPVQPVKIADGEVDPAAWGKAYPLNYDSWLGTKEPRPAGKSRYKKGFDGGKVMDKLSEFPYMGLLFNGWGFGVEYNEPRGHYHMVSDQLEIDASRLKAGGPASPARARMPPSFKRRWVSTTSRNPTWRSMRRSPRSTRPWAPPATTATTTGT